MDEGFKHVFTSTMLVRWSDMDHIGHVNNAVYFVYMEQSRIEWLNSIELYTAQELTGPVIVTAECTYHKPITAPAELEVKVFIGQPGRSSLLVKNEILIDGEIFSTGAVKIVWIDYKAGKSVPLPDEILKIF